MVHLMSGKATLEKKIVKVVEHRPLSIAEVVQKVGKKQPTLARDAVRRLVDGNKLRVNSQWLLEKSA
jgi:hypothetical protein